MWEQAGRDHRPGLRLRGRQGGRHRLQGEARPGVAGPLTGRVRTGRRSSAASTVRMSADGRARGQPSCPCPMRPPQIVAFGGGGFSMEAGNPLLDDYVLGLDRRRAAEGLLRPDRLGRRRPLRRALLPRVRARVAETSHVSLFRRDKGARRRRGRPRGAPARPGPDLRRRRQRAEPARRLARARPRRDPQARLAARRRAVRPVGRLAVLVLGGGHRVPRRRREPVARPRPAAALQLRALRRRAARAARRTARWSPTAACARATRPRTAPRCTSRAASCCARSSLAAAARGPPRRAADGEHPLEPSQYLGDAAGAGRRGVTAAGARRRSSPWAAAASRRRPATRRSTSSCSSSAAGASRASCFLPTACGDPTEQIAALPRHLRRPRRAGHACCRSSAATATRARCARSCSPTTSSTSAAARCATCWRSGARTGSTRVLREAWERGIVLAGLSAGAMCWFEGGVTKSFGPPEPTAGLGLPARLAERARRRRARAAARSTSRRCASGALPGGWAADDGVGLVFGHRAGARRRARGRARRRVRVDARRRRAGPRAASSRELPGRRRR